MWSATFRLIAAPSLPPFPSIFIIFPGHGMRFAAECPWAKGGERGEGENVGESNRERAKRGKKEGKGEGKENKRVENSRIRVREMCLFHFGWKIYVYRIFLFKSIWKIFREVLNLEIIIWSFFFWSFITFLFIFRQNFELFDGMSHMSSINVFWFMCILFFYFFFYVRSNVRTLSISRITSKRFKIHQIKSDQRSNS